MSPLPQETLDSIIDHLHNEPTVLKTCCVVSKSWVPRTRKHLFTHVTFNTSNFRMAQWKKTFPDPSNSPARYTRTLCVTNLKTLRAMDTDMGSWIHAFCNVVHLEFLYVCRAVLAQFCGLSPTVRSLRLTHSTAEVFDLICSFPLLEDLALINLYSEGGAEVWKAPSTSPKLTGILELRSPVVTRPAVRRLLDLPGGLHFSGIDVMFFDDEAESVKELISGCSSTLEFLTTRCYPSYIDTPRIVPYNLSESTKLKHITFVRTNITSIVLWITMTLRTVKSENLRQITIQPAKSLVEMAGEEDDLEWKGLDRLLVQFWITHSIRPQIMYRAGSNGRKDLGDCAKGLLPELTRKELVDLVEI